MLAEVQYTPLRTHKVVSITFQIEGQIWLEKWTRKKAIPTGRSVGPYRSYAQIAAEQGKAAIEELGHRIDEARRGEVERDPHLQWKVDTLWSQWCEMATAELAEATGQEDPGSLGQPYAYEWRPGC